MSDMHYVRPSQVRVGCGFASLVPKGAWLFPIKPSIASRAEEREKEHRTQVETIVSQRREAVALKKSIVKDISSHFDELVRRVRFRQAEIECEATSVVDRAILQLDEVIPRTQELISLLEGNAALLRSYGLNGNIAPGLWLRGQVLENIGFQSPEMSHYAPAPLLVLLHQRRIFF